VSYHVLVFTDLEFAEIRRAVSRLSRVVLADGLRAVVHCIFLWAPIVTKFQISDCIFDFNVFEVRVKFCAVLRDYLAFF
jgi:hypothetical protein